VALGDRNRPVRCVVLRVLARSGVARAADCMIDPFVALRSAMLRDVQPLAPTLPQLGRARCGIVRHRRCLNPRMPRSTPSAYSQRGSWESKATYVRSAAASLPTPFATSPKGGLSETPQKCAGGQRHAYRCGASVRSGSSAAPKGTGTPVTPPNPASFCTSCAISGAALLRSRRPHSHDAARHSPESGARRPDALRRVAR